MADTKTPLEWAIELKEAKPTGATYLTVNGQRPKVLLSWRHAAAAALHGWAQHAHHEAEEIQLEQADYEAALAAASAPSTDPALEPGQYLPHPAALSKHAGHAPPKRRARAAEERSL